VQHTNAGDILGQLRTWTVVGPILPRAEDPLWFELPLDGATEIPAAWEWQGQTVPVKRVQTEGPRLDFWQCLGRMPGTPHAVAFCELEVPEDGTLDLTYDADWMAVWWLDGVEVAATRGGNRGPVGEMHHPILVALPRGRHVFTVRVASGVKGWALITEVRSWRRGIRGLLRTDRGAEWRDYTRTLVRHENRPTPDGTCGGLPKEQFEHLLAGLGVDARWIAVVEATEGSHYPSPHLPLWPGARPEYERQLREWVQVLHRHRIAAMSWYPLSLCRAAGREHPEWRQQYLVPPQRDDQGACCINSGYGEAVISYVIEALRKFDLDGIWFDGAAWSPIWMAPQPVSCSCAACRARFQADTGLTFPARHDWSLPEFRRWVRWRYEVFAGYWQKLVDAIHAAVPEATVVFNHYHREGIGWNGAVPLNPFGRNFVSGTEADSEPLKGAFHTRLMRAYGRPHTEVWMELKGREYTPRGPVINPRDIMDFALSCATAGGHASFGGGEAAVEMPVCRLLADELKPRAPYLGLPSVPYIALHVSQQTETFVFGRNPAFVSDPDWTDYYWNSVTGWHHALAFAGRPCDVVFDAHLTPARLRRYPIVVTPLAVALTPRQHAVFMEYARLGGTLVTGPWYGLCDDEGEPRLAGPLGDRDMFPFGERLPAWEELAGRREYRFAVPAAGRGGKGGSLRARPLAELAAARGREIVLDWKRNPLVCRITPWGRGRVIQLAVDLGTLFRYSRSPLAVRALGALVGDLPRPPAEVVEGAPLLMGIFGRHSREPAPRRRPTMARRPPPRLRKTWLPRRRRRPRPGSHLRRVRPCRPCGGGRGHGLHNACSYFRHCALSQAWASGCRVQARLACRQARHVKRHLAHDSLVPPQNIQLALVRPKVR